MGRDTIRYFLYLNGRWRLRPTKVMKVFGFGLVTMGTDGPGIDADGNPEASVEDRQHAIRLNDAWDQVRTGKASPPAKTTLKVFAEGSVGDGYQRAMALRKATRTANGIIWTKEQEKRDSWPRAWKWLEPQFGDCDPRTIQPEHFLRIDPVTGEINGLVPEIEKAVSVTERHMVIKVYLTGFGADLLDTTSLFWTRGGRPVSRDGTTGRYGAVIMVAAGMSQPGPTRRVR